MSDPLLNKLESLINYTLSKDKDTINALAALSGKAIELKLEETRIRFFIFPSMDGVKLSSEYSGTVNVSIRATPSDLFSFLTASPKEPGSAVGNLEVTGDISLAQDLQNIMTNIDLDWEEHLSAYTGDIFAHQFGNFIRSGFRYAKYAKETLQSDVSEYLRYEKQVLPDHSEVDEYLSDVDTLRDDVERLKIRIDRLSSSALEP